MSAGDVPLDVGEENGNPWTPLKDLSAVIDAAVLRHQPGLQVRNSILLATRIRSSRRSGSSESSTGC